MLQSQISLRNCWGTAGYTYPISITSSNCQDPSLCCAKHRYAVTVHEHQGGTPCTSHNTISLLCVHQCTLHAAPRDFHFITWLKDIKGNCFRHSKIPSTNASKDTECPGWHAHFKSWDRHWLSWLICPLQILGRTLTVLTDVPTSNPGTGTGCPNWYAHFKSWKGHWLSLLRCPLQILERTLTVLTEMSLQILERTLTVLTEVSTSNPWKDIDHPSWGVHFKSWKGHWLSFLRCPFQILERTLTVLTKVSTSNLARTFTVLTEVPNSNSGKHNDCSNWPAKFKSWQGHWCPYWCLCMPTASPLSLSL